MMELSSIRCVASRSTIVAAAMCVAAPAGATAQQPAAAYQIHRDVIRGRVTTDSGGVVAAGEVYRADKPITGTRFFGTGRC